ncbi:hypothetical protein [Flavobacterium sp.]|uniref:hypothetical protein n=1 Tax=Flavobacterium sp. TaxID=239 RepID=UPI0039E556B1
MRELPAEEAPITEEVINDSLYVAADTISSQDIEINQAIDEPLFDRIYECIDDIDSESAFEIVQIEISMLQDITGDYFKEIKKEDTIGIVCLHLKNICFFFVLPLTLLQFIYSFTNRKQVRYKLIKFNLIALICSIAFLFGDGTLDHFNQIKWGYYTFTINQILIFILSRKLLKPPQQ